jgi:hypothetical protein
MRALGDRIVAVIGLMLLASPAFADPQSEHWKKGWC